MQKIILLSNVESLGRRGGLVSVREGYAANYLLPKGLGVRATEANLKRLESLRTKFKAEEKELVDAARSLSERLEGKSLTISRKASEEGHLYGSVTVGTIVEALAAEGFAVDNRAVKLSEPIKNVGVYNVPLALHPDVIPEIKVWVVEEKEASGEASAPAPGAPQPAEPAAPPVEKEGE